MTRNGLSERVMKAVGVFGGSQSIGIICSLVRAKFVAIWLGPSGFGLFAIFNNALDLLSQISLLGIRSSAVRDVAQNVSNPSRLAQVITAVSRWGWILGTFGGILTIAFSPLLSRWSFGSGDYTWAFLVLALAILMNALAGSKLAVLQGLSRMKNLFRASVCGSVAGLLISLPLFYYLRLDSIIPSILAYTASTTIFAYIFSERSKPIRQTSKETLAIGRGFIRLGFFITLSDILNQLSVYVFLAWLNNFADDATVGYYQAGNTLFNRYVGVIFTAIAMEYYPRLAGAIRNRSRVSVFVSHEMKIALYLLVPIIIVFVVAAPLIVKILYTSDFQTIVPFVSIAITGTTLRAVSWCMAMVILSRGDGRIFLATEGTSAIAFVALNILGFSQFGIVGLGYAYVAWYLFYAAVVATVYFRHYRLRLGRGIPLLILTAVALPIIFTLLYL